jgi:hypothetical protein
MGDTRLEVAPGGAVRCSTAPNGLRWARGDLRFAQATSVATPECSLRTERYRLAGTSPGERMIVNMHETEKGTAEIDVIAAGINAEAARAVSLAEELARSAHKRQSFARFASGFGEDDSPAETTARLVHEEELADKMGAEAERVRDAAGELQSLARQMRSRLTTNV